MRSALDKAAGEASDFQSLTPPGADAADTAEPDADGSVGISQAIEIDDGNLRIEVASPGLLQRRAVTGLGQPIDIYLFD